MLPLSISRLIFRTPLFKVASLNSLSVVLKLAIGIVTSKVLAVFIGPAGLALTGNFRNFLTSVESVSTLGFQNGILKYVVDTKDDEAAQRKLLSTIFISLIVVCTVVGVSMYFLADFLAFRIFGARSDYGIVFTVFSVLLPLYAGTVFLNQVLNGLGRFRKVIYVSIIGNVLGLLFCLAAVYYYQTMGALFSIIIPPVLVFFVAWYFVRQEIRFENIVFSGLFDFGVLKNLSSYSLMALFSSVMGPLVFLAIRNDIISHLGIDQAGYWEAMTRISSYYLLFVSTILTVYFYPKLTFAGNKRAFQNVIKSYYLGVLPLFVVGLTALYFLRSYFVHLFFSKAFLPVTSLFFWQLLGDVFKVGALILGYQFYAQKLTVAFILTETISLFLMYTFSHYFIVLFGINGVVMAHAATYFIYLLILLLYFKKRLF